ncbi:MAG: ribose 5-phosphate isomerase B [Oscillospiraceae bacterium]|nr:ribose 5-phosphate isomerase B [Oscillospiraceae bacterium]
MTISVGSDHGGYPLKERINAKLEALGHSVLDCGCDSIESCDYPQFGAAAARAVADGRCERGIVICTTGIGISIAANKIKGIRCALCTDPLMAELTRRHNDANMLALGAGIVGINLAERIVEVFLATAFEGGRHARRVDLISALEESPRIRAETV